RGFGSTLTMLDGRNDGAGAGGGQRDQDGSSYGGGSGGARQMDGPAQGFKQSQDFDDEIPF
ncbi:MAG: single-stranded DNA-binding protein, partial [Henriciella sp.]|nr:single-stranded DNA-binding protein [Henriciella sp.]